ncbi:MAG: MarR family transcriptional regulator [Planctomycetota bacterium]
MSAGGNHERQTTSPSGLAGQTGKRRPFDHPEVELYLNLVRTAERLATQFDALFREHGVSQTQYNALRILQGHGGPVPSGTVAREMVTREPDITRLLERLQKLGYITRDRSEHDKRIMLASLTDAGGALLERLQGPVLDLHKGQFVHMSAAELTDAIGVMERMREAAEDAGDEKM